MRRPFLNFAAPAVGLALAVAGLALSGTVAARTTDRAPVEVSRKLYCDAANAMVEPYSTLAPDQIERPLARSEITDVNGHRTCA